MTQEQARTLERLPALQGVRFFWRSNAVLRWALLGLLVRLLVMPFTMHTDWRFVGDMVALNYEGMKLLGGQFYPPVGYPPLTYYTVALFLLLFKPLMPIFPISPIYQQSDAILSWTASSLTFRYDFLMKAWYLPFDFGTAFLLLHLSRPAASMAASIHRAATTPLASFFRFPEPGRAMVQCFAFWMVSPLVLYGPYVHGEFDLVPTFFVVLSLFLARLGRTRWSVFFLGIGACYKVWPFFFLPFFALLLSQSWWERVKLLLIGTVPYALLAAPRYLLHNITVAGETNYYGIYVFPAKLEVGFGQVIYVFIAVYIFTLWFAHRQSERLRETGPGGFVQPGLDLNERLFALLWPAMLAVLLLYYSVSVAALHYYVWAMPFAALLFARDRRVLAPYLGILAGALIITISIGRSLAWGLATPISPLFFQSLPSPAELIEAHLPVTTVVSIGRSILAGSAAWVGYYALTSVPKPAGRSTSIETLD